MPRKKGIGRTSLIKSEGWKFNTFIFLKLALLSSITYVPSMKNIFTYVLILTSFSLLSVRCGNVKSTTKDVVSSTEAHSPNSVHLLQAVLWQQTSAQYKALSYQA